MAVNKRLKRATLALALTLAGAGATMATASPGASAAPPGNCQLYATLTYGQATCYSANIYRAYDVCVHAGTAYSVYGPWTTTGGTSRASCNDGDLLQQPYKVFVEIDD